MALMRLLKSSDLYPVYLRQFYAVRPGLSRQSYEVQYAAIMADCFTWADAWKRHLEATGRWSVCEVIPNALPLQRAWARARGVQVDFKSPDWALRILELQIAEFQPEIYFQHGFAYFTPEIRHRLRQNVKSLRLLVGYDGIAREDAAYFEGCDAVLSCVARTADYYARRGIRGIAMKLGFDPGVLDRLVPRQPSIDASFVGGIALGYGAHGQRVRVLAGVSRQMPLELRLNMASPAGVLRHWASAARRGTWRSLLGSAALKPDYWRLWVRNSGAVFGLAMYQALSASRVSLNVHIDAAGETAANMRLFEATGVGSCLLTDAKTNLAEWFEPGREVVVYSSVADCVAKLRWLLDHESERSAIARAGQARTLREHNLGSEIVRVADLLAGVAA
jgi:hypothetical protein